MKKVKRPSERERPVLSVKEPEKQRPILSANEPEKQREVTPVVSLQDAVSKAPVSFSNRPTIEKEERRRPRKEVNLEELKKTLQDSLKDVDKKDEGVGGL